MPWRDVPRRWAVRVVSPHPGILTEEGAEREVSCLHLSSQMDRIEIARDFEMSFDELGGSRTDA